MTIHEIIQHHPAGSQEGAEAAAWLQQEKQAHPFFPLPYFTQAKASGGREEVQVAALYAPQRHLLRAWMQGTMPESTPHAARPFTASVSEETARPRVMGEPFAILAFTPPARRTVSPVLSIHAPLPQTGTTPYLNSLIQIKVTKFSGLAATIRSKVKASAGLIAALPPVVVPPVPAVAALPVVPPPVAAPVPQSPAPRRKIRRPETAQLLDQFLETSPSIGRSYSPYNEVQTPANVLRSVQDDPELVTETLAKIYERQEKFKEAIAVYQKLCLLFPKKRAYFEGKIQQLNTV